MIGLSKVEAGSFQLDLQQRCPFIWRQCLRLILNLYGLWVPQSQCLRIQERVCRICRFKFRAGIRLAYQKLVGGSLEGRTAYLEDGRNSGLWRTLLDLTLEIAVATSVIEICHSRPVQVNYVVCMIAFAERKWEIPTVSVPYLPINSQL